MRELRELRVLSSGKSVQTPRENACFRLFRGGLGQYRYLEASFRHLRAKRASVAKIVKLAMRA